MYSLVELERGEHRLSDEQESNLIKIFVCILLFCALGWRRRIRFNCETLVGVHILEY